MIHRSTRKRVCDKLLESLGSARRGGRELDIIICYLLGDTSGEAGKMIQLLVEEGYPWNVVAELLDEELPPYTTTLDAALPGENIVLALHSPRRGRWAAVHETPAGEQVLVWAASECLARRGGAADAHRRGGAADAHRSAHRSRGAAAGREPPRLEPDARPRGGAGGRSGRSRRGVEDSFLERPELPAARAGPWTRCA